jgi:hypothetical protein
VHQVVIESGYMNTATTGAGANSSTSVGPALVKTGIGPRVEFDVTPPVFQATNDGVMRTSGATDAGFGLKAILGYSQRASYGVGALMTVPSGGKAFSSGANTYSLLVNGSYALSGVVSLFQTASFNSLVGADSTGKLVRFGSYVESLGATYNLPSNWSVYAEGSEFSSTSPGGDRRALIDYGVIKNVGAHLQFDAEVGNALNAVSGSRFHYFGVGASFLLGKV